MPKDLDIYTPRSTFLRMARYLIDVEGYAPSDPRTPLYADVVNIRRIVTLRKGDRCIDLVQSSSESPTMPIAGFYASHLVNFITADGYFMAYPGLTLRGRSVMYPGRIRHGTGIDSTIDALREKYRTRGYQIRMQPWDWAGESEQDCVGGEACPLTARFFGDSFCLRGTFGRQHPYPTFLLHMPSAANTLWWRGGEISDGEGENGHHSSPYHAERVVPTVLAIVTESALVI